MMLRLLPILLAPPFVAAFAAENALDTCSSAFDDERLVDPSGNDADSSAAAGSTPSEAGGGESKPAVWVATAGGGDGGAADACSRPAQSRKQSRMSMNHALVPRMTIESVAS